jgi:nitrogen fixation protein NifU and related proteins
VSELYTVRLLDHYRHPHNRGHLETPDLAGEEYNALCGDRVRIEIQVRDGRIAEAWFEGRGCALCLGAASILTETITGRTLHDLQPMDAEQFLAELESPIRPARLRCALLPWIAFRRAAFGEEERPA